MSEPTRNAAVAGQNSPFVMCELGGGQYSIKQERSGALLVYGDTKKWETVRPGTLLHMLVRIAVEAKELHSLSRDVTVMRDCPQQELKL